MNFQLKNPSQCLSGHVRPKKPLVNQQSYDTNNLSAYVYNFLEIN